MARGMHTMNDSYTPVPPALAHRLGVMSHDLRMARELHAAGRLGPRQRADLERLLGARLTLLEAEVHARLLDETRRGTPIMARRSA